MSAFALASRNRVPVEAFKDDTWASNSGSNLRDPAPKHAKNNTDDLRFRAPNDLEQTRAMLILGLQRFKMVAPARMRLWRWQTKRALVSAGTASVHQLSVLRRRGLRGSALWIRQTLPLFALFIASACSLFRGDGPSEGEGFFMGPLAPELSKPKFAHPQKERNTPWAYVLPLDHGIRADVSGQGHFRAPRFHGEHNGLDLLAPVGTPIYSPCNGQAMAGTSRSFGRWLHIICPVPDEYMTKGGPRPWASFFFAHLNETKLAESKWVEVETKQTVGAVGKTGNAQGDSIQPHVHLEFIIQKNHRSAMDERHLGNDQSDVRAAQHFADVLAETCMVPHGFEPKSRLIRRARRIDPFVALTCLSQMKPNYQKAPSPLTAHSNAWNEFYVAKSFNVNLGVEDSSIAKR